MRTVEAMCNGPLERARQAGVTQERVRERIEELANQIPGIESVEYHGIDTSLKLADPAQRGDGVNGHGFVRVPL
jgi:hypothetical protein